jgi:beta-glucosidase/6-phospho-beta-glucosidase/beta-galactosidase/ABC-type amino acid transport substrate-binding protein
MLRSSDSSSAPPAPLLFGVATADHQCEAYDPRYEDIRDIWEQRRQLTARGLATDFWNRYTEDINLARDLGCKVFRFSLAWSRLEPEPGKFNDEAFDHYKQLIEAIRAAGMEPVMTLHHFTWPLHVEQRGGMIGENFPSIYTAYVSEVVKRLGQQVRYWITFNEPTGVIYGYIKPWWEQYYFAPPGLPDTATLADQLDAVSRLMRNLFLAHTAARQVIKQGNPEAMVGVNPMLLGLPAWLQRLMDKNLTRLRDPDDWHRRGQRFASRRLNEYGAVDAVIATLTATRERSEQVDFSESYFATHQALLVRAESTAQAVQDLAGQAIAVVKLSTAEQALNTYLPKASAVLVNSYDEALRSLDGGQAVALLADEVILHGLMKQHPGGYRLLGTLPTTENYVVAIAKGHPDLLTVVNRAVNRFIASGDWASSTAQHLPEISASPPSQMRFAETVADISGWKPTYGTAGDKIPSYHRKSLLERIKKRGYIIVAVKEDVPGFGYRDPQTGELRGLEIDLARAIAQEIFGDPTRVTFRPAKTGERLTLVRSALRFLDPLVKLYSVLSTAIYSNWWHLGMAGKLPEFICPSECVGQQDFVGFDYYWGISTLRLHRIQQLMSAAIGHYNQAPVWPGILYGMLKNYAKLFPDKEILLIENGCVDTADGFDRAKYIEYHVREVERARRDGVKVPIYICWSITSNREWGLPFGPGNDFGLYHIDLDTDSNLQRIKTPAVEVYQRIIERYGAQ